MSPSAYRLFFWTLFSFLSPCASEDPEVSCVFMESCVLPCSFRSGPNTVINWLKRPHDIPVHSYYHGQNQFKHQHENYRDRTSLFEEEISRGNASLLLTEVKVQDEGEYECFTNTAGRPSLVTYIKLRVRAPVVDVSLEQRGEELLCRSEGIYPQPEVSWTPSTEHHTTVETTENGLYSVVSSVRLPHSPPHEHSCNVSTLHSWRSATYRNSEITASQTALTVPCTDSTSTVNSLVWTFNNHQIILIRTGSELVYSESWRPFVDGVSESGSLTLKDLTKDHQGLYSCVLRADAQMSAVVTEVTLRLRSHVVIEVVTVALFFISIICLLIYRCRNNLRR